MKVLLLDDLILFNTMKDDVHTLPAGVPPEDLWTGGLPFKERSFDVVALSGRREARDLYRVLALVERFIRDGGAIWIMPPVRAEPVPETFLALHPGWSQAEYEGRITLTKSSSTNKPVLFITESIDYQPMPTPVVPLLGDNSPFDSVEDVARAAGMHAAPRKEHLSVEDVAHAAGMHAAPPVKVISVAAFGDPRYWDYLPALVRAHHAIFPGYILRIHHDDQIYSHAYGPALLRLQRTGLVQLRRIPTEEVALGKCRAMLWRLAPAWDPDVDYVFCRDLDSLPTWEDRCACEEFIRSGLALHVIHSQPVHVGIMGGLSGFRAAMLRLIYPTLDTFLNNTKEQDWTKHGVDQDVMNALLAPHLSTLVHSLFTVEDEAGEKHPRSYLDEKTLKIYGVIHNHAPFDDPRVPEAVREAKLTNYPGAADFDKDAAIAFFNQHLDPSTLAAIREAEGA